MPKCVGSRNPDDTSGAAKSEPQLFGIGTFSEPRFLTHPQEEVHLAPKEHTHEDPGHLRESEVEPPSWVPIQRDRVP